MKKEIKAVIFDVGGVIDHSKLKQHYATMRKKFKINKERFNEVYHKHSHKARIGKITTKQYIEGMAKSLKIDSGELYKNWINNRKKQIKPDKQIKKIIKKLRKKGYILGILSNVTEIHKKIRAKKGCHDHFHFVLSSCDQGTYKPQLKFYKILLKKLKNLKPEQIVFIDDWRRNLTPAKKLGMKTILFKNNKQLVKELKKLGVKLK